MTDFSNRQPRISVFDAIGPALSHVVKVLFRPFIFIKWLKFGLVAFLIALGSGGGFNFNLPLGGKNKTLSQVQSQFTQALEWIETHLILVIILVIAALLIITTIWTLLIYFSSRFSFVYLDGVVKNDLQIKRAYKANRTNAWSYFLWRIIFVPNAWLFIALLTGLPAIIILLSAKDKGFTLGIILLLIFIGLVFIGLCIILSVINQLTFDFVVPIMYLMKIRVLKAWRVFLALLRGNKGRFFLYIIMRVLLALGASTLILIPCCLFGCISIPFILLIVGLGALTLKYPLILIGVIPIILIIWIAGSIFWQTIISPITVFFRTYPLVFLEGFGDEFTSISQLSSTKDSLGEKQLN